MTAAEEETPATQEAEAESGPKELGDKLDELNELRDRKRELNAELKELDERYKALEWEIIQDLDQQGTDMSRTPRVSASIGEQVVPNAVDWDEVQEYIRANDAQYLYERRLASGPCNELWQAGETIPGVEPFTRRKINLRKR